MKKILIVLISCLVFENAMAQVTDSAVKTFSSYICNCIDTLDLAKDEAALKKDFTLCKSLSLANILNLQLITPEMLADKEQSGDLEKRSFALLSTDCEGIKRLVAALKKEPSFSENNADNIFTPPAFFLTYKMKPGERNNLLHVYNNLEKADKSKYQRAVDIRWTFKTEADALKWHRIKLEENSEGGEPVKDKILIQGAQELKIYREGKGSAEMMKSLGITQRHHYFLFVYKNIVCKVFVATDDKTGSKEIVPFAMAAVKQLRKVVK
jgi:hypothetical protein